MTSSSSLPAPSYEMATSGGWGKSTLKKPALLPYISSGVILAKAKNRWRIPGEETAPDPEKGEFIVFLSFLDRGLAFPTSRFLRQFLNFYNIKLSDLTPHCIQQISFFTALCEGYLGYPHSSHCGCQCSMAEPHGRARRTAAN